MTAVQRTYTDNDKLIGFQNVKRDVSKPKNGDAPGERISLGLTPEQAADLLAELQAKANSPTGIKIDLHIRPKTNSATGLTFESAFGFVKVKGAAPATAGRGPGTFVPKTAPNVAAVAASIAAKKV